MESYIKEANLFVEDSIKVILIRITRHVDKASLNTILALLSKGYFSMTIAMDTVSYIF